MSRRLASIDALRERLQGQPEEAQLLDAILEELGTYRAELEIQNDELREAQLALERSHRRYVTLFSSAPVAYLSVDQRGIIQDLNEQARVMLGEERAMLCGRPLAVLMSAEDQAAFHTLLQRAQHKPTTAPLKLRSASGPPIHGLAILRAISPGQDAPDEVLVALLSLSSQHALRDALGRSEARYKRLFELAQDGLLLLDGRGQVQDINQAGCALLHDVRLQLIGRPIVELLRAQPPLESWERLRAESAALGEPRKIRVARRAETLVLEMTLAQASFDDTPLHVMTLRDVTARERASAAELALERARQESQRLDSLGRLAGGIAHDMNNLLTVIVGMADMIQLSDALPHQAREDIGALAQAAQRGQELVHNLLSFARRHDATPRAPVEVGAILRETTTLLRRTQRQQVQITLTLPDQPLYVRARGGELGQILLNLALNGIDAMPHGGTLALALSCEDQHVKIDISDSGEGMNQETLDHAFDPFFTTKEHGKGTGLGLSTVYGLMRQLEGTVGLESTLGYGTRVRLRLPACQAPTASSLDQETSEEALAPQHIIIADDQPIVLRTITRAVEQLGHHAHAALNGEQALALLDQVEADIMLLDVDMPVLGGLETAERALQRRRDLLIVLMSGMAPSALPEAGSSQVRFLQKPFTTAQLNETLATLAYQHTLHTRSPPKP